MEILADRITFTPISTISNFSIVGGSFKCFALEPPFRGLTSDMPLAEILAKKIKGKTAMPTGRYEMDWYYSPDHGIYLPRILGVPGFDDDEVHIGNTAADTKGCLILGTAEAPNEVQNSKVAIDEFYPLFKAAIAKERVYITIK